MFLHQLLRFGNLPHPFYETPGEGGGGGGWPDFEVPEGVGGQPAGQPAGEPAGQPAGQPARAGEAQPGQPAQPAGGQPAGQPGRQELPEYRQRQIAEREQQQFNDRVAAGVKEQIKALFGPALGLTDGKATLDPRQQRAREMILTLMPELKDMLSLAPKAKDLLGIAEQAPQWKTQNDSYWQGVAGRTLDTIFDGVAKLMLGDGKAGKDLDPEMQDDLWQSFTRWCGRDTAVTRLADGTSIPMRVARYESQDQTLVPEFLKAFGARYVDPARRSAAVVVTERGRAAQRQPVQGSAGQPPAAKPPAIDNKDEDAVHGRGWAVLQQLRGA